MGQRAHLHRFAVAVCSVALVTSVTLPASAAPRRGTGPYVALGDSYVSGPLIPVQGSETPGCLRSDQNYPHLVAAALQPKDFKDASCSGATTDDMTAPQDVSPPPANAPQLDRLDRQTMLVTLGIGGNDIGFVEIIENCSTPVPTGTPCQDRYVVNGRDEISARIAATAPKVKAVLQEIHKRSREAKIYVVGYPAILPESGGESCWPQLPVAPDDVPYLLAKEKELNAMLAAQAAANRATYVDTYTPSIGHDACQLPINRWVEPLVPSAPAAPVHPNAAGEAGMAAAVLAKIKR